MVASILSMLNRHLLVVARNVEEDLAVSSFLSISAMTRSSSARTR